MLRFFSASVADPALAADDGLAGPTPGISGQSVGKALPARGPRRLHVEDPVMLMPTGGGLILFGLSLLLLTVGRRIQSEEDFKESEQREREITEMGGFGSGRMAGPERWSRLAYRHPHLTRRPLQLGVAVGAILILVDILNH